MRNPLDCAIRVHGKAGAGVLFDLQGPALEDVLEAVLKEYLWFVKLEEEYPDRFFCLLQDDLHVRGLAGLARFLELDSPGEWLAEVRHFVGIHSVYDYEHKWVRAYHELTNRYFGDYPVFRGRLLALLPESFETV